MPAYQEEARQVEYNCADNVDSRTDRRLAARKQIQAGRVEVGFR